MELLIGFGILGLFGLGFAKWVVTLRRVASTNEVHIVQTGKETVSYGKDTGHGNSYYEWPSWLPILGVTKVVLPVSNFDVDLKGYEAYDKGRLPFMVDVKAFFRIKDSNIAAQRVASFTELHNQLEAVVQGAVRTILANSDIEEIMQGRGRFGQDFTSEVNENLANWGVETVRNIELMDIRDSKDSRVIHNIMDKKKSQIEMESRTEVAKNKQLAMMAEIDAQKEVDLQKQDVAQLVGLRQVESQRQVELQNQSKIQAISEQQRTTKEKEMAVFQVEQVALAETEQKVKLVQAEQNKRTLLMNSEAQRDAQIFAAEAQLETKKREAQAITLEGTARADAEKAIMLAPVEAQITLAKEIGENASYQKYLITIRQVEANQAVGIAQASALEKADVKVISNTGSPTAGINNVMDLFSSRGGTELGAMLEGLSQTEVGQALVSKVTGSKTESTPKLVSKN